MLIVSEILHQIFINVSCVHYAYVAIVDFTRTIMSVHWKVLSNNVHIDIVCRVFNNCPLFNSRSSNMKVVKIVRDASLFHTQHYGLGLSGVYQAY